MLQGIQVFVQKYGTSVLGVDVIISRFVVGNDGLVLVIGGDNRIALIVGQSENSVAFLPIVV